MPHHKFQRLVDLRNQTMVLLACHWLACKMIMASITDREWDARKMTPPPREGAEEGMDRWLRHLNKRVDQEHRIYNQWPMWVAGQLDVDRGFFGRRH